MEKLTRVVGSIHAETKAALELEKLMKEKAVEVALKDGAEEKSVQFTCFELEAKRGVVTLTGRVCYIVNDTLYHFTEYGATCYAKVDLGRDDEPVVSIDKDVKYLFKVEESGKLTMYHRESING